MKTVLTHSTNYHIWANTQVLNFIAHLNSNQLEQPINSSFTSIKATIVHMANAEYNWLKRIGGNSQWENGITEAKNFAEISDFWLEQSKQLANIVAANDITGLMQPIEHQNLKGEQHSLDLYKIIMHVCNHATYHRGQLVTMLRQVGFTQITSLDMSTFFRL